VWNSGLPLWPSGLMDLVVSWFLPFHPIAVMVLCFSGLVMKQRFDNLSYVLSGVNLWPRCIHGQFLTPSSGQLMRLLKT
jgi:hypothetical protein